MLFKGLQIYYDDDHTKYLINGLNPHFNPPGNCDEFFENRLIVDFFDKNIHLDSEYFGVFSWDFCITGDIFRGRRGAFNIDKINSLLSDNTVDVLSFSYRRQVDLLKQANKWHHWQTHKPVRKREQPNHFTDIFILLLNKLGFEKMPVLDRLVYENTHITKSTIYQKYVNEVLRPSIQILTTDKEMKSLFFKDAGYPKSLPESIKNKINFPHYPFHPFVLERLFTYWLCLDEQRELNFQYW